MERGLVQTPYEPNLFQHLYEMFCSWKFQLVKLPCCSRCSFGEDFYSIYIYIDLLHLYYTQHHRVQVWGGCPSSWVWTEPFTPADFWKIMAMCTSNTCFSLTKLAQLPREDYPVHTYAYIYAKHYPTTIPCKNTPSSLHSPHLYCMYCLYIQQFLLPYWSVYASPISPYIYCYISYTSESRAVD